MDLAINSFSAMAARCCLHKAAGRLFAMLSVLVALQASPLLAQTSPAADPTEQAKPSQQEIDQLVATLEDPQRREAFLSQLKTLEGMSGQESARDSLELRSLEVTVYTVSFSAIYIVDNLTKDYSYYMLDVGVAYREDTDEVVECLLKTQ